MKEMLLAVNGVKSVHDLHLWALTLSHHAMSVHVAVGECSMNSSYGPQGKAERPTGCTHARAEPHCAAIPRHQRRP